MDFFARQDRARKQSSELVGLFIFSVSVVVLVLGAVLTLIIGGSLDLRAARDGFATAPIAATGWWALHAETFALCAGAALLIVLAGTLFKLATLAAGGAVV